MSADGPYSPPDEPKPLGGYATLSLVFNGSLVAYVLVRRRSGDALPERIPTRDIVLLGLATFKLSRLITKDKVTSFLRAPFTRYVGPGRPAEVSEKARGEGVQRAIGELLTCPYCIGQWIGTGLIGAYLYRPRLVRTAASVLATVTVADYLQQAWVAVDKAA